MVTWSLDYPRKSKFCDSEFCEVMTMMTKKRNKDAEKQREEMTVDFHTASLEELFVRFNVNPAIGLSSLEAKLRLARDGPNALTPPPKVSEWIKFLKSMMGGFSILLWSGCIMCLAAFVVQARGMPDPPYDNLYLGVALGVVVLITGLFSYYQESKSTRIMDSFKNILPQ
ncbi:unnamed protein product, partial [Notodromas monacha]